jgi:hypothetical protein
VGIAIEIAEIEFEICFMTLLRQVFDVTEQSLLPRAAFFCKEPGQQPPPAPEC